MTLLNVCSLINNVNSPAEEAAGEMHEDGLVGKRKLPMVLDGFSVEAMLTIFQLQKICHSRAFQHWEVKQNPEMDTCVVALVGSHLHSFLYADKSTVWETYKS